MQAYSWPGPTGLGFFGFWITNKGLRFRGLGFRGLVFRGLGFRV